MYITYLKNFNFKLAVHLYLYCLCAEAGLMLVARSFGKARNSSSCVFWLLSLRCTWSRVLSALRTAARTIPRQRTSSLDRTRGRVPVGLVTSGVMPVKPPRYQIILSYKWNLIVRDFSVQMNVSYIQATAKWMTQGWLGLLAPRNSLYFWEWQCLPTAVVWPHCRTAAWVHRT